MVLGSSNGRYELVLDDRRLLTVRVAAAGFLGGPHEELAAAGSPLASLAVQLPAFGGQELRELREALTDWLDRPLQTLAGDVFEHRVTFADDVTQVTLTFAQAGTGHVASTLSSTAFTAEWNSWGATAAVSWAVDITVLDALRESLAEDEPGH